MGAMRRPVLIVVCALVFAGCGVDGEPGVEAVSMATGSTSDAPRIDDGIALEAPVDGTPAPVPSRPTDVLGAPVDGLPSTVAVVGDSLTESAADEIETTLTRLGIDVMVIDGVESRRMTLGSSAIPPGSEAIEDILAIAPVPPDVWVVALGTNDVGGSAGPSAIAVAVQALLDLIPPDARVIWVDLWIRDQHDEIVAANAAIRQTVGGRSGSAVADWFVHGDEPGVIGEDGVHLTADGQWLFARSIADAIVAQAPQRD
jgi:lysophospholipase L1-like esterase